MISGTKFKKRWGYRVRKELGIHMFQRGILVIGRRLISSTDRPRKDIQKASVGILKVFSCRGVKRMTVYQAWVFARDFLRSRYLRSASRGSTRRSTRRSLARLSKAVAVIDASLGYADGVSGDMSHSDAWRICRPRAMRCGAYLPSPIRLRQKPFYIRMRRAVWTLDAVFGFDDKGLPFQCRYHGRMSRQDVTYGYIDDVYTELCPHCGREVYHLFNI